MHIKYITSVLLAGHLGSTATLHEPRNSALSSGLSRGFIDADATKSHESRGQHAQRGSAKLNVTNGPLLHLDSRKKHGHGHGTNHSSQGYKHSKNGHNHSSHQQGHENSNQRTKPTAQSPQQSSPSPTAHPTPTTTSKAPSQSPSNSSPTSGQTYTGDITYYTPGLGSCGVTNSESDMIVALAEDMMAPEDGANPNDNPLCGRSITITHGGVTATATIEDTCPGCSGASLDLTPALFQKFAALSVGRVSGVQWSFN